jgi:hypothetical protein
MTFRAWRTARRDQREVSTADTSGGKLLDYFWRFQTCQRINRLLAQAADAEPLNTAPADVSK